MCWIPSWSTQTLVSLLKSSPNFCLRSPMFPQVQPAPQKKIGAVSGTLLLCSARLYRSSSFPVWPSGILGSNSNPAIDAIGPNWPTFGWLCLAIKGAYLQVCSKLVEFETLEIDYFRKKRTCLGFRSCLDTPTYSGVCIGKAFHRMVLQQTCTASWDWDFWDLFSVLCTSECTCCRLSRDKVWSQIATGVWKDVLLRFNPKWIQTAIDFKIWAKLPT